MSSKYDLVAKPSSGKTSVIPGYQPNFRSVSHSELAQSFDRNAAKVAQMMAVAQAPGKQLFMMAFMLWMSGSSLNIFSIMMTGMALSTPIYSLMSFGSVFAKFSDVNAAALLQAKLIYLFINGVGLAMGAYKLSYMGLLPLYSTDWMSMLHVKTPLEISGGGSTFSV